MDLDIITRALGGDDLRFECDSWSVSIKDVHENDAAMIEKQSTWTVAFQIGPSGNISSKYAWSLTRLRSLIAMLPESQSAA